jgi:hemoglobin
MNFRMNMDTNHRSKKRINGSPAGACKAATLVLCCLVTAILAGCGTGAAEKKNQEFFTSGSREADQRASQRMAKAEQLAGSGEGAGEPDVKKASSKSSGQSSSPIPQAAQAESKQSLYERLGKEDGLSKIVDDFTQRALQDPRVNWERRGVKSGGLFHHAKPVMWQANPQNVAILKKHLTQFLALATGGPAHYDGKEIKQVHSGMRITNPEFDAAVGDLKASLDKLQIPNKEQKELLAIIESTRPQIVEER